MTSNAALAISPSLAMNRSSKSASVRHEVVPSRNNVSTVCRTAASESFLIAFTPGSGSIWE
jgi:hypothetical protein